MPTDHLPHEMTEEQYRRLPEESARAIEVVHGHVIVYRCLDERGAKPEAADALIVVEVSSPSTAKEDLLDKKSQYALAGIPLYLVVVMDTKYEVEEVREFRLDAHAGEYRLHRLHRDGFLHLEHVVLADILVEELTR